MIHKVLAKLKKKVIYDIALADKNVSIGEAMLDGSKLDEIHFSATIKTQEDISRLKRFLTIARTNIK